MTQKKEVKSGCAHIKIRHQVNHEGGRSWESWYCGDCNVEFALASRPDEMKGEEEDTEEDANKLNLLADWFDMGDKEMSSPGSVPEVQDDLRRIAKYLASRALTEKG